MKKLMAHKALVACVLLVGFVSAAHGSWHVMSAGGKNYITNDVAEGESPEGRVVLIRRA